MNLPEKPLIIPVFIPQEGCPHQCVFCNQEKITGVRPRLPSPDEIELQVESFLKYTKRKTGLRQIAFYGGNFLGLEKNAIENLLHIAGKIIRKYGIQEIRFSTRPDSIDLEHLNLLSPPVSTIELGVQSMDDRVLNASRRGHTASDTLNAVELLKKRGIKIGLQMMVGLPEDTEEKALDTANRMISLSPDFVRIYPTVVLSKSVLAARFLSGRYLPLQLNDAVTLVKKIFLLFKARGIPVIRMGLQPSTELNKPGTILAGPFHPAFGHLVYSDILLDRIRSHLLQSESSEKSGFRMVVHPRNASLARGLRNHNLTVLREMLGLKSIDVCVDAAISESTIIVNGCPVQVIK